MGSCPAEGQGTAWDSSSVQAQVIRLPPKRSSFIRIQSASAAFFSNVKAISNKKPSGVQLCKSERRNAPLEKAFQEEQTLGSCGSCGATQPGEPGAEQLPPHLLHWGTRGSTHPSVPRRGCQACPGARQEMLALSFLGYCEVEEDFAVLRWGGTEMHA